MKFIFRADSGSEIGIGHVMRCLTLALKLQKHGHEILFLCKPHIGNIINVIKRNGIQVAYLSLYSGEYASENIHSQWLGGPLIDDANQCVDLIESNYRGRVDWLIVDHYAIDSTWHNKLRSMTRKILVIDDLADREHDCDLLLDQTVGRLECEYVGLIPKSCNVLLGTKYALLRDEFSIDHDCISELRMKFASLDYKRILIMMGGTDHLDITSQIIKSMERLSLKNKVTVILGPTAVHRDKIAQICSKLNCFQLNVGVKNVAPLILGNDICIGAAGASSWERCALGMPTILIAFAANQKKICSNLVHSKAAREIPVNFNDEQLNEALNYLSEKKNYFKMSAYCLGVCDGNGANRVMLRLINETNQSN